MLQSARTRNVLVTVQYHLKWRANGCGTGPAFSSLANLECSSPMGSGVQIVLRNRYPQLRMRWSLYRIGMAPGSDPCANDSVTSAPGYIIFTAHSFNHELCADFSRVIADQYMYKLYKRLLILNLLLFFQNTAKRKSSL